MELLETALKKSIEWLMSRKGQSIDECGQAELELHTTRVFISHFKIELNHLMGLKWFRQRHGEQDSLSERDSLDSLEDDDEAGPMVRIVELAENSLDKASAGRRRRSREPKPSIKIKGKYSGVYNISGQTDDDEEQSASYECTGSGQRYGSRREPVEASAMVDNNDDNCTDDGYRSLSRGSNSRASFIQQLNDVKSRIIDLVHELDHSAGSRLSEDELEAYRRRRDVLLAKLDLLIENHKAPLVTVMASGGRHGALSTHSHSSSSASSSTTTATSSSSLSSRELLAGRPIAKSTSLGVVRNKSESNLHSDYEEQVQVIDYGTRLRDRRHKSDLGADAGFSRSDDIAQPTRSSVFTAKYVYPPREQPIDFGAMMRDFEAKQGKVKTTTAANGDNVVDSTTKEQPSSGSQRIKVQHVPSSSSTSETSSSSFI